MCSASYLSICYYVLTQHPADSSISGLINKHRHELKTHSIILILDSSVRASIIGNPKLNKLLNHSESKMAESNANANNVQNDAEAQVGRIAVKLPQFWPDKASLWFVQAEAQFFLGHVTHFRNQTSTAPRHEFFNSFFNFSIHRVSHKKRSRQKSVTK